MSKKTVNLSFELKEVSTHAVFANYKDYFDLNAGAIILHNFILVIDTLVYPRQAKEFRTKLEKKYNLPVKYLFITHSHSDHYFGVASFKDVEIFGSNNLIEVIKKRKEEDWNKKAFDEWKKSEPELIDIIDEIEIIIPKWGFESPWVLNDNGLQVEFYLSGGHTRDSAYAYFPHERILFTGDLIASGFWPFISDPTESFEGWIKSFEHMITLNIKTIIPGHGWLVGKEYIHEQLSFMKDLKKEVLKTISEGKGFEEIIIPDYPFEPAEDWQIPRALEHLHNYYSKKEIINL
jgi:glyoxylase-like metal-dependent hydrolase (beta-lactamase superfamily II)